MQLTGCGPASSRIGHASPHAEAVLCRGNTDAMGEVLAFLDLGVPVALTGGGTALRRIATAADELKSGKRTSHPELFLFKSWAEVQEYVENDASGQDLRAIVQLSWPATSSWTTTTNTASTGSACTCLAKAA